MFLAEVKDFYMLHIIGVGVFIIGYLSDRLLTRLFASDGTIAS